MGKFKGAYSTKSRPKDQIGFMAANLALIRVGPAKNKLPPLSVSRHWVIKSNLKYLNNIIQMSKGKKEVKAKPLGPFVPLGFVLKFDPPVIGLLYNPTDTK